MQIFQGALYDFPSANEIALSEMVKMVQYITAAIHNKSRVHIHNACHTQYIWCNSSPCVYQFS